MWCLPPEMDSNATYSPTELERVDAWSVLSCPEIDFQPCGLSYKANDADIYFGEYYSRWLGNGVNGRYRNQYLALPAW